MSYLLLVWKFIRANKGAIMVTAVLVLAGGMGWVGRGKLDAAKIEHERALRRACEAEVKVWQGAADANDRARAELEATLKAAASEWAKVAEELRRASEAQRRDLEQASRVNGDLWDRYRASLGAALPTECDAAVRETAARLKEVAR